MESRDDETTRLQRLEEQLRVNTAERRAGAVRFEKETYQEPASIDVEVTRDEIELGSRPADRAGGEQDAAYFEGDVIVVPIIEERLEVRKVPYVVEEIEIHKVQRTETQTVTDTVRKERLTIVPEGDLEVTSNGPVANTAQVVNPEADNR